MPESWQRVVSERMGEWSYLNESERTRLSTMVRAFTDRVRWEAAGGLDLTDDIRAVIAADACLLVLELGLGLYRDVTSIIVYPTTAVRRGTRSLGEGLATDTTVYLAGEARLHGPVLLVWDAVGRSALHPETGHNVVHHEMAHKLDMVDGSADGMPLIFDHTTSTRLDRTLEDEYRRLCEGVDDSVLDPYGATNRAELFAVATEAFFGIPELLESRSPRLYSTLREIYRQDPAERRRR